MLCLALALQLEIVHLRRSVSEDRPRKWGPKLRAKWEFSTGGRNAPGKRQKGVNSFVRGAVHFIGHREIKWEPPHVNFICSMPVLPVLKGPVQLQCGLDEGPFPASTGAECDPQPR
jgi:hypothetical protein